MAAYAAGPRIGAAAYDVVHTYAIPVGLGAVGVVADTDSAIALALIWLTHIGVDRAIGYGLKYPTGFKDTHLQRVETSRSTAGSGAPTSWPPVRLFASTTRRGLAIPRVFTAPPAATSTAQRASSA